MNRELKFGLVLNLEEESALERLSEAEGGLSQAATVCRLIRREARRHGLWLVQDGQEPRARQVSEKKAVD